MSGTYVLLTLLAPFLELSLRVATRWSGRQSKSARRIRDSSIRSTIMTRSKFLATLEIIMFTERPSSMKRLGIPRSQSCWFSPKPILVRGGHAEEFPKHLNQEEKKLRTRHDRSDDLPNVLVGTYVSMNSSNPILKFVLRP